MPRVIHGCNEMRVQAGYSVGILAKSLLEVFNIPAEAIAFVNGQVVSSDCVIGEDDTLEFVKTEGVKGVGQVWTGDQFCKLFGLTDEQLAEQIAKGLRIIKLVDGSIRITDTAVDEFVRGKAIESPYLSTDEAAAYCNLTKDAFYGRVERRKIVPLPGSGKENRFTREQCDKMMTGE